METLHIRFHPQEPLPKPGNTITGHGFGTYEIRIHQILSQRTLPDGFLLLDVKATRRQVNEKR